MVTRAESEFDAAVLDEVRNGPLAYADLGDRGDRARLDTTLDRLLAHGYIAFRFTGRELRVTDAGRLAVQRAFRRGWRSGKLIDADQLYPHYERAVVRSVALPS